MRVNYSTNSGASPSWWMGATYIRRCAKVYFSCFGRRKSIYRVRAFVRHVENNSSTTTTETVPAAPQKPDSAYTDNILSLLWPTTGWIELREGAAKEGMRGWVEKSGYRNGKYYIYIGICLSYMSYECTYIRRPSEACRYSHHHPPSRPPPPPPSSPESSSAQYPFVSR